MPQPLLEQVEHDGELREDDHAMAARLEARHHAVQQLQLAALLHQARVVRGVGRAQGGAAHQPRVSANPTQLPRVRHARVEEK